MADATPPPPDTTTTETPPPPDSSTTASPPPSESVVSPPPPDTTVASPPPVSAASPPPVAAETPPPPVATASPPPAAALSPPVAVSSPPPVAAITPPPPSTVRSPPPASTVIPPPPASTVASPPPPSSTTSTPPPLATPSPPSTTPAPSTATSPPPTTVLSPPPPKSNVPSSPPPPPISSTNLTTPTSPTPTPPTTSPYTPLPPGGSSLLNPPPPPPVDSSQSPSPASLSTGAAAGVGLVVAAFVIAVVGIFVCYRRKKRPIMEGYQQGYPNGFGMPNSAQFSAQQRSGEAPFLMSPSRAQSANYSGPRYNNSGGPYNSGGPNSYNNNSKNYSTGSAGSQVSELHVGSNQSCFSYEELFEITEGFAPVNILGEGGFGCVYKGKLPDGKLVAVKQLKGGGGQGEREFQAEVEIISRVHHRHLVSLVGFCISEDHRLLVYDFVSNGTLHYHIHTKGRPSMEWSTRVKVAAGSARGLAYLHEDCHPKIIHRDIKSANILIDDHFEAQVADFGLARLTDANVTHVSTRVMGTFGYLAPEYASTGKLTEKSDVFSFGVVLLELITGRKPVDGNRPPGEESLVEWARPLLGQALESEERDFKELVDPKLLTNYKEGEMFHMIETAAACIRHSASRRPKMSQVVRVLDSLTDEVDISNGVQPGKSQMFNVANTADIRLFQKMAFGSQEFSSDYSRTQSEASRNF